MSTDNIYQAPEAELVNLTETNTAPAYFTTSLRKMAILSIITINSYSVYWCYKHWQAQKLNNDRDCWPVIRAIFQVFFVFSLFSSIKNDAEMKKISVSWNSGLLAVSYILLVVISSFAQKLIDEPSLIFLVYVISCALSLLAVIPLLMVQKSANAINGDPKGLSNAKISGFNWLFIVLGAAYWLFIVAIVIYAPTLPTN